MMASLSSGLATMGPAWERALSSDRPVVLEVYTDPNVMPLPPHITFDQAKAYMSALLQGDVDSWDVVKASAREGLGYRFRFR
jgi:pyruvate dehydrogenase (quinone)